MGELEDRFITIARSNVVHTPRDCASDDASAEFYDPAQGTFSQENTDPNQRILEMPNKVAEFHNYRFK